MIPAEFNCDTVSWIKILGFIAPVVESNHSVLCKCLFVTAVAL